MYELTGYRKEVTDWLAQVNGATTEELINKFPGIPLRAMEVCGHIVYRDGKWFTSSNVLIRS